MCDDPDGVDRAEEKRCDVWKCFEVRNFSNFETVFNTTLDPDDAVSCLCRLYRGQPLLGRPTEQEATLLGALVALD